MPKRLDLVGTHEIAAMLGVTRQRVQQLAHTPGFPEPVAKLTRTWVWLRPDVTRWAEANGYPR